MPRKQKKSSSKRQTLWTLDTETRGLFGKVFRIGLYNGQEYYSFNTVEEAYQLLQQYAVEEEIHCYIHNLDFDLSKMAHVIAKDIDVKRSIFISHNVAVFGTNKDIILHDSLKIIPGTLEKICKDFGLGTASKIDLSDHVLSNGYALDENGNPTTDKKKMDKKKSMGNYFNLVSPDEEMLNIYLEHDCTSLHKVLTQVMDIAGLTLDEFVKCPTTASMALKVFKELFPDDYADATSSKYGGEFGKMVESMLREGYYGGRTEVFIPHLPAGYHYDVNSLYPYCMKTFEFPYGFYEVYQDEKAETAYKNWKRTGQGGGFLWCRVYVPEDINIPPLPYRAKTDKGLKGKLIFPTGKLEGVWAYPELAMAEKVGCKIEVYIQAVHYFKTYKLFEEFVIHFQELKQNSKGAKRIFAKLIQNALYGKFGQQRSRTVVGDISELEKIQERGLKHTKFKQNQLGVELLEYMDEINSTYIQVQIAGYVTAYARILLYEGLTKKEHGNVAYCDTDSIACSEEFDQDLIDENLYGKWKLENVIEEAIFLQPKMYFEKPDLEKMKIHYPEIYSELKEKLEKKYGEEWTKHLEELNTVKAKGIPGDILKRFTQETYEYILQELKTGRKDRVMFYGSDDAIIQKEKLEVRGKFISLLKMGLDFDQKIKIQKGMNLRSKQKRKMDYKNNNSTPWNIPFYEAYPDKEDFEREALEEIKREAEKINPYEEIIQNIGFIKIPLKNDLMFSEYQNISPANKKKYFKRKGLPIDVWTTQAGIDLNSFIGGLK